MEHPFGKSLQFGTLHHNQLLMYFQVGIITYQTCAYVPFMYANTEYSWLSVPMHDRKSLPTNDKGVK
jgi:hypothetical protein